MTAGSNPRRQRPSPRKEHIAPMTAGSNPRRQRPLSQKSL
ncbi:hypothetical protein LEMLEM_LOCUS10363 [Lemmus lemmus]